MTSEVLKTSLDWEQPPLCYLSPDQQIQVNAQAEVRRYRLGEVIWSTHATGDQFLLVSGNVRLLPDEGKATLLKSGDWFGDLPHLSDQWKARAASREVEVIRWDAALWLGMLKDESRNGSSQSETLQRFWNTLRSRYQPDFAEAPQPVSGYPFVPGVNTAAACLTMLSQRFEAPAQFDWIKRQLRGQQPRDISNAAEKLGLQLRRLLIGTWGDLRQTTLPALIHWQDERWVVLYEVRGDRLVIADPMNPNQTCESLPRSLVQEFWDGQLWQVELVQKQDTFNLGWFLPAVLRYRGLLSEVLLASFTLQLLGLATPIITQVVIDKVMVQGSIPTLDVMAIALLCVAVFEATLGILRMFIFTHTTNRLDLGLSAQLFRHLLRLPLS